MPANERMDALIEKATELGAAAIQPLAASDPSCASTASAPRAVAAHWQQVVAAASEQSGRTRVPTVGAIQALPLWLAGLGPSAPEMRRVVLGVDADARWGGGVMPERTGPASSC